MNGLPLSSVTSRHTVQCHLAVYGDHLAICGDHLWQQEHGLNSMILKPSIIFSKVVSLLDQGVTYMYLGLYLRGELWSVASIQ